MANKFDPNDGGKVLRDEAEKWIKKLDNEHRPEKDKDTRSIFFVKEFLKSLLETPDCAGISFFLAKKFSDHAKKDVINLVLLPTKADGTLLYASGSDGKDMATQYVWDTGKTCPPTCP